MIPKIIHYCWFGRGEMPRLMKKCIKSWKRYCPDWQIIQWNEENFDVNSTVWTSQAYGAKKYAFVSDYVRLKALHEMGGIYLDTDVQLIKPLEAYLEHKAVVCFENKTSIATCLIASEAGHPTIKGWLDYYLDREYMVNGKANSEPNVVFITEDLKNKGLVIDNARQSVAGVEVYPQTWFCPQNIEGENRKKSRNTVAIHHFTSTWRSKQGQKNMKKAKYRSSAFYRTWIAIRLFPKRLIRKILGESRVSSIKERLRK